MFLIEIDLVTVQREDVLFLVVFLVIIFLSLTRESILCNLLVNIEGE